MKDKCIFQSKEYEEHDFYNVSRCKRCGKPKYPPPPPPRVNRKLIDYIE